MNTYFRMRFRHPHLKHLLMLIVMTLLSNYMYAQVSGTVFRDFNANGIKDNGASYNEIFIEGVTVKAYDASGAEVGSTTTDQDGAYSFTGLTLPLRIEFIPFLEEDYAAPNGSGSKTSVQFYAAATTTANFGINYRGQYTPNSNPKVYVPQHVSGNPLGGGDAGNAVGLWSYPYNHSTSNSPPSGQNTEELSSIGATWGLAYSRQAQKIFTAAFIKRHSGLGPLGTGGIYMLTDNGSSYTTTNFYDLDANGYRTRADASAIAYGAGSSYTVTGGKVVTFNGPIDPVSGDKEGLGVVGSNSADRLLPANMNADSYDPAAFDQVGKVGLGDLEISDDGKFLFVINLYSRKLMRLELDDAYTPTSVVAVTEYALPAVTVTNGVLRPFGVGFYRNKVYVGAVSTGENGGVNNVNGTTDLYAYVFEVNTPTATPTFNSTPIISFPLNYLRGYIVQPKDTPTNNRWKPWTNDSDDIIQANDSGEFFWSSPIFSNIEFTERGDMVLDFMDRGGHQHGYKNYTYLDNSVTNKVSQYDVGGEVLVAGYNQTTGVFTLESNGSYNSNSKTYTGQSNNEGPGGGEFFHKDLAPDDYHHETSQGAAAIVPGTTNGIFTLMDPTAPFSGGTAHFSTTNGATSEGVYLYGDDDGYLSKANGLGDIEVLEQAQPTEIGNRVWEDTDGDGIQDAGESPIAGVTVQLLQNTTVIATATTDNNGNYYFSNAAGSNTASAIYGITALQPNTAYTVRIPNVQGGSKQAVLGINILTLANIGGPGQPNVRDSDGLLVGDNADAAVLTSDLPAEGANNHTFDFGFWPKPCNLVASADGTPVSCHGGNNGTATATPTGNSDPVSYLWSNGATTQTISGLSAGTYTVTITETPTCTATASYTVTEPPVMDVTCSSTDVTTNGGSDGTASVTASGGTPPYTYLWNTGATTSSISGLVAGTYSVTVTDAKGCTAECSTTVNEPGCNLSASADGTPVSCNDGSDGTATATPTGNNGAVTYLWSNGATTQSISGLSAGTYTVTITDAVNCTAIASYTVTEPPVMDVTCSSTDVTTNGGSDGTASVTASGGTPPYTYLWNTGATTSSISGLTAGTYTVTVTDAKGCTAECSTTVNEPAPCELTDAGKTNETCNDNNTAANLSDDYITFSLNPTGTQLGTGYTVSVSGGFTISPTSGTYGSATAFQLNAGSANGSVITVTITDNNDAACTITTTVQKSNCSAGEPDLSLTKEVDDCEGEIGQNTIFTLTLENTGTADATGVVITDVLPAGLTYISHTPNNITYNQVSGEFNVGTVAVGQTVTIQITVQPTAPGYYCNTANITATSGDSSVDNDEGRACFMVPIELCPGDSYTITLDAGLTNIQWYKDGILIPGATEASLTITEPGVYSYTADNANCPQTGCCPVVFILGNCCPAPRCVAVGVIKLN